MAKYLNENPYVDNFTLNSFFVNDGYECIDQGIMCSGDIQDALFQTSSNSLLKSRVCQQVLGDSCPIPKRSTLQEDGSDFFIVTGVNHNTTGSLYSSIAMYNVRKLESIGAFTSVQPDQDPFSYVGSANSLVQDDEIAKSFYAVKISRKCEENEKFCLQVTKSGPNSLPLNGPCLFIERIYLYQMEAGPATDAIVKPIVYHFSSKLN